MKWRGRRGRTPRSAGNDELQRQLAIYRVLHERYVSNAGLQWQVAVYIIAAQAALLAGIVAARTSGLRIALGVAIAVVGILGILVCRRIELTAWIDREHLDELEAIIADGQPQFLLHHGDNFVERLDRRGLSFSRKNAIRRLDLFVARHARPGVGLALLMAILGLAGVLIALLGS
jgi:hypothetical protein